MNTKSLKKLLCLLTALVIIAALSACGTSDDPVDSSSGDHTTEPAESNSETTQRESEPDESVSETGSSTTKIDTSKPPATSSTTAKPTKNTGPTSLSRDAVIAKMPSKLKGTTLKYFYWWDAKTQMEKDAIAAFEKATGITVKTEVASYTEFPTELAARISAGNAPDLVRLLSNAMYQIKSLQPITNSGFDFNDTAWDAGLMKNYTYDGRTYAVNLVSSKSAIVDAGLILYNTKALQRAELEDPYDIWKKNPANWTWDKLMSISSDFLKANRNKEGYYGMQFTYENAYIRAFGARNYDYNPKTGKWENYMKDPELAKRYENMIDAVQKRIFVIDGGNMTLGKTLFCWHGPFALRTGDQTYSALKESNSLGVVPMPTDSKYQVLYEYTAFGIPVGAKNKEAVPYYLRYVLDRQSYDMNKVYINAKAKEVMDWICNKGNFFWGENTKYEVKAALYSGTSAQVKATLDSMYGVIQETVDAQNELIKSLNK